MALDEDHPAIDCFRKLGDGLIQNQLANGELPTQVKDLEKFVCQVYCKAVPTTLPELRWKLFRSRNLEGEMLPPMRASLLLHITRANFMVMRDKSYTTNNSLRCRERHAHNGNVCSLVFTPAILFNGRKIWAAGGIGFVISRVMCGSKEARVEGSISPSKFLDRKSSHLSSGRVEKTSGNSGFHDVPLEIKWSSRTSTLVSGEDTQISRDKCSSSERNTWLGISVSASSWVCSSSQSRHLILLS